MDKKTGADKAPENLLIQISDETKGSKVRTLKIPKKSAVLYTVAAVLLALLLAFCIIAFTPVKHLIPGYPNAASRQQAVRSAMKLDSLENRVLQWELYTENLKRVVLGEEPVRLDSLIRRIAVEREKADSAVSAKADSTLRSEVEAADRFVIYGQRRNLPIEGVHFFSPLKGIVSKGFEAAHPFVDISAPSGTVIMSVLDGTVIITDRDEDEGYSMVIQHEGDIVSVYRHLQKLMKNPGDRVTAGTPIGLLGEEYLQFELWSRGNAVDPTEYIGF